MRVIREGGFIDSLFHNSATDFNDMFFVVNPQTDCGLFWGGLWNIFLLMIMFMCALFVPLGFLVGFFDVMMMGILSSLFGIDIDPYFMGGLEFLDNLIGSVIINTVITMGVVVGLIVGFFVFIPVPLFCIGMGVSWLFSNINNNSSNELELTEVIGERYRGFKDNYCSLVTFERNQGDK